MSRFPFLPGAMVLVSKGSATPARRLDLDEAVFAQGLPFQL